MADEDRARRIYSKGKGRASAAQKEQSAVNERLREEAQTRANTLMTSGMISARMDGATAGTPHPGTAGARARDNASERAATETDRAIKRRKQASFMTGGK